MEIYVENTKCFLLIYNIIKKSAMFCKKIMI